VFLVRALPTIPLVGLLFIFLWYWWFHAQMQLPFSPLSDAQLCLKIIEWIMITLAIVVAPALLAGSLAGEKTRNTLGLLLACLVSPREIVSARMAGRLSVVGVILLPALPPLLFVASFLALPVGAIATLLILPMAVAFGGGGLAIAASAVARRGRDALVAVYLIELLFLLVPIFGRGLPLALRAWVDPLFPYHGIDNLIEVTDPGPALLTSGVWFLLGFAGGAGAVGRLRPGFLRDTEKRSSRRSRFRWGRTPPVSDRPILWKELYIEQLGSLNRFVRWLAILIVAVFVGITLILAATYFWSMYHLSNNSAMDSAHYELHQWMQGAWMMSWLLEWTMGLRAAVAVAAERERQTWDGLLLTPLDGREIVLAKIYGSLYSIRWFAAAIVVAWTAGVLTEALSVGEYITLIGQTLAVGVFMVASGVLGSLSSATGTGAITKAVVAWLVAWVGTYVVAVMITVLGTILILVIHAMVSGAAFDLAKPLTWAPPISFETGCNIARITCYLLLAMLMTWYCRRSFDRLAGRSFKSARVTRRRRVLSVRSGHK
jgi:ABC-type transport system involved in multi-copper enzyme maturation permease subunit